MYWLWLLILSLLFGISGWAHAESRAANGSSTMRLEDFGAVGDDRTDCTEAFRRALAAARQSEGPDEIVLGEGRYRLGGVGKDCAVIEIQDMEDLVIRGEGRKTQVIITNPRQYAFWTHRCKNVLYRDFTIDYDPLPFTQGRIVAIDVNTGTFDLSLQPGFPDLGESYFRDSPDFWGMVFEPEQRQLKTDVIDHIFLRDWERVEGRTWRLQVKEGFRDALCQLETGDRFVQMARYHGSTVGFNQCEGGGVENMIMHASVSLAVAIVKSQGVSVRGLRVEYLPGSERLLASNGDGVHCQNNRRGPIIEDCLFEGLGDDAINIYGLPLLVREVRASDRIVVTGDSPLRRGDQLQIMDPRDGRIVAEVEAVSVEQKGEEAEIVLSRAVEGMRAGRAPQEAHVAFNLSACGAGYVIRNNHMRNHRRFGTLLAAGHGIVEGNTYEHLGGYGVVINNSPDWPEGPIPSDIIVRGNTFIGCGHAGGHGRARDGASLYVRAVRLGYQLATHRSARNLRIEGNSFLNPPGAAIFLGSVSGAELRDNRVYADPGARPWRKSASVILANCERISVDGLSVTDTRPETTAAVAIGADCAVGTNGVDIRGLETGISETAVRVSDHRGEALGPKRDR